MSDDSKNDSRPQCKYGSNCYQTNSDHKLKYKHPRKHHTSPDKTQNAKKKKVDNVPKKNDLEVKEGVSSAISGSNSKVIEPLGKQKMYIDSSKLIKELFLVDMPDDFYQFWEFCGSVTKNDDRSSLFKAVNLYLVGPFDVLLGDLVDRQNKTDYLLHWRYFYDPPEFQTIFMCPGETDYHIGYYRDSPSDMPCFVASNEARKDCIIKPVAENIFGAVLLYLESMQKKTPFASAAWQKIIVPLKDWAKKHKISLESHTHSMKKRQRLMVAKTFHGAGIVVPYEKKTELGYRPLIESNATLKLLISNVVNAKGDSNRVIAFSKLQPIINMANIATDECDFGTGLELGLDLFSAGEEVFHSSVNNLLSVAYNMLQRDDFGKIIEMHLKNRRKGSYLSVADLS